MNTPDTSDSARNSDSAAGQVESMRTLFGTPRLSVAPVLHGTSADEVVANPKIAIVDDEPINIKVVQKHLEHAGYKRFVTTTESTTAIDLVRLEQPDVVLLDIMMPHISGLQILETLRQIEEFVDLPIIILTAADNRETKLEALALGATEFLGKPVDSVELESRLRNVLTVKAHQDRVKNYTWELELEVAIRSTELAHAHGEMVDCLAKVGEYRDNETGRHVIRVGSYAEIIARRMGLASDVVGTIRQAAALHDIGKVAIPDSILLKPGKLDADEFTKMQEHCLYGRRVFERESHESAEEMTPHTDAGRAILSAGSSPTLKSAATIAYTHHEKWDGSGYPRGLAGEAIPIEGRITAVADVFDALTSKRPYKEALSLDQAFGILRQESGKSFDPAVIDAFFDAIDDILQVYTEHSDIPDAPAVRPEQ
jgi:putative two-component system response regulator